MKPIPISCNVTGIRSPSSLRTGSRVTKDWPKSSVSRPSRKLPSCSPNDRSSPIVAFADARASSVPKAPTMRETGSTGRRRSNTNPTTAIASSCGRNSSSRLIRKPATSCRYAFTRRRSAS